MVTTLMITFPLSPRKRGRTESLQSQNPKVKDLLLLPHINNAIAAPDMDYCEVCRRSHRSRGLSHQRQVAAKALHHRYGLGSRLASIAVGFD